MPREYHWFVIGAAALLLAAPSTVLAAEEIAVPAAQPLVKAALASLQKDNAWTLTQQTELCEIPAPPFKEAVRAAEVKRRFVALGFENTRIDSEGNVIAERPGTGRGPTVVLSAHLDTVFPEGTDVKVKREAGLLKGPGIGDDCRGLGVLMAVARAMQNAKIATPGKIYFVGTVGEEGQGNLRGVRHLFGKELKGQVDYFLSIDGTGLAITARAVGSHRYRVHYQGPGGHSYGAFGMPNPLHAMGRAMAKISDLQVPKSPKTTFNVGVVSGGTSVNSIAMEGVMDIDLRSESPDALDRLDREMRAALTKALDEENGRWPESKVRLTLAIDDLGLRPASLAQNESTPIVRTALAAGRALGFTPPVGASSTDANIPMSLAIPAITIDGGGEGKGAHSLSEQYADGDQGYLGPQWALLIVTALAGVR